MISGTLKKTLELFMRGMCRKDCFAHGRRIILRTGTGLPGKDALRRVGALVGQVRACLDRFGRVGRFRASIRDTHETSVRVCFAGRRRGDNFPCALGTGVVGGTLRLNKKS